MRQLYRLAIGLLAGTILFLATPAPAQELAKRLILTDGTYQLATKWEVKGERVRYLSAERNEWEEVPKSMVDWAATDKYEKDRAAGKPAPEAVALDKELEAERQADEARSPHVAPGLRLPDDGGVILLDTFQTQPQLVELQQSSGELNKNMKGNILRATINPIASAKQIIELPGLHAKIQAHVTVPAIYVNLEQQDQLDKATQIAEKSKEEQLPWDRFQHRAPAKQQQGQAHRRGHQDRDLRQGQPGTEARPDHCDQAHRRLGQGNSVERSRARRVRGDRAAGERWNEPLRVGFRRKPIRRSQPRPPGRPTLPPIPFPTSPRNWRRGREAALGN